MRRLKGPCRTRLFAKSAGTSSDSWVGAKKRVKTGGVKNCARTSTSEIFVYLNLVYNKLFSYFIVRKWTYNKYVTLVGCGSNNKRFMVRKKKRESILGSDDLI
jgi:hypothetical protein